MLIEILFCAKGKIFIARFDSPREFASPLALILKMAVVLSGNRLGSRKIQTGKQIQFIQKIMDIFVDIFHSLPSLRLYTQEIYTVLYTLYARNLIEF